MSTFRSILVVTAFLGVIDTAALPAETGTALYSEAGPDTRSPAESPADPGGTDADSISVLILDSTSMPVRQAALAALNGDGRRNAMLVLGLLALQEEILDEAFRWLGKLQAVDPEDPEAPFAISVVHLWAGSPEEALRSLRAVPHPDRLPRRQVYLRHLERATRELADRGQDPVVRCILDYYRWYEERPATDSASPPPLTDCGRGEKSGRK